MGCGMESPGKNEPKSEVYPDSWQRFERAVDAGVKSGPKHRKPKKKARAQKRASSKSAKP